MVEYEPSPGLIYIHDEKFICECGEEEFRVLADKSNGAVYVCWCGQSYNSERLGNILIARLAALEEQKSG